jgi:ribosomal protein S18 acetylase RimI-like enzyme
MSIRMKLARREDAAAIADMSRRFIEHGLPWSWDQARVARCIAHPECAVLTACDRRRLAGFAIMQYYDAHAHLSLLAVQPGSRHQGVGRSLVEWLEASARVAGTFIVRLELRATNPGAYAFYERLGYRETARRPGYYAGSEDALCMMRDLAVASTSPS